jgi:secondary thiamine-phosphate synthase enzyme
MSHFFTIRTTKRNEFIDITKKIRKFISDFQIKNGYCKIFVPHTTSGITINENADFNVERDLLKILEKLIPKIQMRHLEGNSDAHLKASLIGNSVDILIENYQMVLGTWQGIFFAEFDGPRQRKIIIRCFKE